MLQTAWRHMPGSKEHEPHAHTLLASHLHRIAYVVQPNQKCLPAYRAPSRLRYEIATISNRLAFFCAGAIGIQATRRGLCSPLAILARSKIHTAPLKLPLGRKAYQLLDTNHHVV